VLKGQPVLSKSETSHGRLETKNEKMAKQYVEPQTAPESEPGSEASGYAGTRRGLKF
jgi:hypothetical protein